MDDAARAKEMWSHFTGKTLETMTLWADANQRVMSQWVEFSSGAVKEGLRLYGALQTKATDGVKELAEGAYGPQAAFRTTEETVQTLTRAVEWLQAAAEQASKGIQATLAEAVTKAKEIYVRA